jgi:pyrroline-5-carboxylate reductase
VINRSGSIAFIGGGNMARSLIGGLIAARHSAKNIRVAEPEAELRAALARDFGVAVHASNLDAAAGAEMLVLAVKPQVLRTVCAELAPALAGRAVLVLSIAAGVRIAQFERWLGAHLPIVRAMPNTPALIGAGVSGLCANAHCDADRRAAAEALLRTAGSVIWIDDERLMDVVTAVSGSGPAYFFALMEAMETAAISQGLAPDAARRLVLETAFGAASMARGSTDTPSRLREKVTSPGGTTAAALAVLEDGGFSRILQQAIARASARGRELSDQLDLPPGSPG